MDTTRAIERLERFATYPNGWHYGEGIAFGAETIAHARRLITQFAEAEVLIDDVSVEVFPGLDGSIAVSLYVNQQTVNIYVRDELITEVALND